MPYTEEFFNYYNKNSYVGTFLSRGNASVSKTVPVKSIVTENVGKEDYYFSINNIQPYSKRCVANVSSLNWCFADLDVFHDKDNAFTGLSAEQVYGLIMEEMGNDIPVPTYVVDSGRGLYLLWKINQSKDHPNESKHALNRWKKIQKILNERLSDYCADVAVCMDCSRLLRIPGSFNRKTKTKVSIIEHNPDRIYSLYALEDMLIGTGITDKQSSLLMEMNGILPQEQMPENKCDAYRYIRKNYRRFRHEKYGKASKKQLSFCRAIQSKTGNSMGNIVYYHEADLYIKKNLQKYEDNKVLPFTDKPSHNTSYSNVYKRRTAIIENLVKKQPDCSGMRENILFLYRYYCLCFYHDNKKAADAVLKLNSMFISPLSDAEAIRATRSAEKYAMDESFNPSKKIFCDYIGITVDDYDGFTYTKGFLDEQDVKAIKNRKKDVNRNNYLKRIKESGKTTKKEEISTRRERIKKLLDMGYADEDIMMLVGISESTYYRDKKYIVQNQEPEKDCEAEKVTDVHNNRTQCHKTEKKAQITVPDFSMPFTVKNSDSLILYVRSTCDTTPGKRYAFWPDGVVWGDTG